MYSNMYTYMYTGRQGPGRGQDPRGDAARSGGRVLGIIISSSSSSLVVA